MNRPTLFLDFDGVFNIFPHGKQKHHKHWGNDWTRFSQYDEETDTSYLITGSASMAHAVLALGSDVDLVWLSTWKHRANAPFSCIASKDVTLPALDDPTGALVGPTVRGGHLFLWWKVDALRAEMMARPRDFIWLDDDYSRHARLAVEDVAETFGVHGRLVATSETLGITQDVLDDVVTTFRSWGHQVA